MKVFLKRFFIGIFIFVLAGAAGYASYRLTMHYCIERLTKEPAVNAMAASRVAKASPPLAESKITAVDSYLARLENGRIAIYAVSAGNESFLYHLSTRAESLSAEDKTTLEKGISLPDRKALASFEEDFTN